MPHSILIPSILIGYKNNILMSMLYSNEIFWAITITHSNNPFGQFIQLISLLMTITVLHCITITWHIKFGTVPNPIHQLLHAPHESNYLAVIVSRRQKRDGEFTDLTYKSLVCLNHYNVLVTT
jgi:hypothetical protein